ncbi:MAG: hypothetical protein ABI217_08935 [Chthoniobacterales bacterium]
MPFVEFDSFRAELGYLNGAIAEIATKTLRDDEIRERIRLLSRGWLSAVRPAIFDQLQSTREFYKLSAAIEKIAQLTSKFKPVAEYRRRLRIAQNLANTLVLKLPIDGAETEASRSRDLFLSTIPDLPTELVPTALIGWRSRIQAFVDAHRFDESVFVMIRYRTRNASLIKAVKNSLHERGLFGVIASEHQLTDDLYNPIACLLCCSKGIAIFDRAESTETFNPNVAYELGMLHLLGRQCLILKHRALQTLHTDILMKLYVPFSGSVAAGKLVTGWVPSEDRSR